jgi:excisionase family DNA binding protein
VLNQENVGNVEVNPAVERVGIKPERAAAMLDCSRAAIYKMIKAGDLPSFILPGNRMIRIPLSAILKLRERASVDSGA